ncbi:Nicotinamide-nucleotide adenylyltransferase, NadR family / Ribosylnicotinamide kinase [Bifidobacterium hapali]|uniref:Nicotinamide-nucleotide adenylyltransferase, NadR family / Ribosylnicotinamide kinase n=1 Tax=Bifidobacterium hapali TaxID=1630172 RepID=A0A261FWX2_9BIFI|nr:AAA family ATPase [Bifidobacterium hapali]OZG63704.1 Nicotinamide-nucleotide adenylyltransferase, NadR family / Ribosylnicotinamide kinase [Bifidobacterium hapali]
MPRCNLTTAPLTGSRFAVVVSRFSPLHAGLEQRIYDLASRYDGVVLVLASRPDPNDGIGLDSLTGMSVRNRFRYLREAFNDDPAISPKKLICAVSTSSVDAPDWIKQLQDVVLSALAQPTQASEITVVTDIVPLNRTLRNTWPTVASESVKQTVKQTTSEQTTADQASTKQLADQPKETSPERTRWNVGTFIDGSDELQRTICAHPHDRAYWSTINHTFRREFTTVVLVVGSASVGKTTMVTRLSKLFDAPIAVEYAREFEENRNVDDDELTAFDYQRLILSKFAQNEQALASDANHGIVFLDTDAMVTKTYVERYLPVEEAARLDSTFDMVIRQERPDLVLVIPPVTEYVDDGFRAMQWASDRYKFHETLMRVIRESPYADRVVMLDDRTFAERDAHAIRVIGERTGFTPRQDSPLVAENAR